MEGTNYKLHDVLSSSNNLTVTLLAILLLSLLCISISGRKKSVKCPPYAPGGMLHHVKMCTSSSYPWWILDVAKQLQTRVFQVSLPINPLKHLFIVGEPSTARSILADPLTSKPLHVYAHMRNVNGSGSPTTFTLNGPHHQLKRKAIAPAFSSNQVKRMTRVALDKTEAWIKGTLAQDSSFDVAKEMVSLVLSAISETAFEYEMNEEEKQFFGREIELALIEFSLKTPSNPLRILCGWFLAERRRAYDASRRLKALVMKIMDEYRNNKRQSSDSGTLIQLIMESDAYPTDDDKSAQLLEFLLAGHDTTAYSIAWVLLNLAKNPEEQSKLRAALAQLPPENWNSSQELQSVIMEGMRLSPVGAAGSIRTIGKDIMTSKNEVLPKGSICFLPFMLLFRNPDVFDNPDRFKPSRWKHPTREMLDSFIPFSHGKQNCVGQSLARAETSAIVARICSEFELYVEDEGTSVFFLTLKPVGARLKACRV
jgi:cytochrome P450